MPEYKSREERRRALQKDQKNQSTKTKKGPKKGLFKKIFLSIVAVFILLGISGVVAIAAMIHSAPPLKASELKTPVATNIYFSDGSLMTTVGSDDRIYAPINKIPNIVKEAFISTEDTRFYSHFGIDPYRIGGAILANFTHGFGAEGGSTITQQVVKNDILTSKKTVTRKVQEAYLAIRLEQKYSKDQILEMYLNTIYLGDRSYGVGTAAQDYFGLSINNLNKITLPQAAMLAGLPQAPSAYDPRTNPVAAKQRRDLVLDLMAKNHVITKAQADAAKKVPISAMLKNAGKTTKNPANYDSVVNLIETQYVGKGKPISQDDFYSGGLSIHTTIDKNVQNTIDNTLNDDALFSSAKKNIQAGVATLNTQTGAILGIGGGRHYTNGINWAIAGDTYQGTGNQIGSTAKPLIDYGPAIEYLNWSTVHQVKDQPYTYAGTNDSVGEWDGSYWGNMTIERALIWSRNVPAVETLNQLDTQLGKQKIIDYENKLGIKLNPSRYVESYAIGSFTANPLEIAGAYATYGNNGIYNAPHILTSIDYPDGRTVKFDHEEHVAVHDYTAYMITDMLKGVTQTPTTYHGPSLAGYPIVGKSGSTNVSSELAKIYNLSSYDVQHGNVDEWFTGYSPKITTSVWTGYIRPSKPTSSDGIVLLSTQEQQIAGNIFGTIMTQVSSKNTPYWTMPNSVVRASVEADTGLLASAATPKSQIVSGLFVKGTEPTQVSQKYQPVNLSPASNLKAAYDASTNTVNLTWDYKDQPGVSFEIEQNTSSGLQPIGTSNQHSFVVNNVQAGTTYQFSVVANYTDTQDASQNKTSSPVSVQITIPGGTPAAGPTPPGQVKKNTGQPGTSPNPAQNPGQGQGTQNPSPSQNQGQNNQTGTGSGGSSSSGSGSGGNSTTSSNSSGSNMSFIENPMGLPSQTRRNQ